MAFGKTLMAATALSTIMISPAFAQDSGEETSGGIQEIVVTAQKRSENVQDVPIAISAFTADSLSERAVTSVASLSNISPNVTLDAGTPFSGSSAVLSAYIRGIGANDFAFNIDPGVGIYLDGVYLARSVGANQDLPDVERIEVLKGPQGTLFGRNTIGGAISIVTHDPGKEFRFKGDLTVGKFGLIQTRGTVDLPLGDSLSSSVSFSTKNRKGYLKRLAYPGASSFASTPITNYKAAGYDNIGLGSEGGDGVWNLRGKLKYDNGGPFRVTLTGDYSDVDQSQLANRVIATTPAVFAGTYNCAIQGIVGDPSCGGGPPGFAYIGGIGGLNTIFDNPTVFGVNVDANPANNRLPYDDRFVTSDIDTSYANGNNYSKLKSYGGAGTIEFDLPETPHTEFWKGIKPVEKVFRDGGLPEVYMPKIAEGDERYWVPISETVSSKPVWISPAKNMWADVLMSKSAGLVNRHYHPHPIWAYTISGKWAYLEHDWTATAGDFIYETPGESHTLVCYEHEDPMKVFFVVSGPLMWLDEEGNTVGHYDVFDYMKAAREHYDAVGIGADYVDTLIR